jgi:hypothetical protein
MFIKNGDVEKIMTVVDPDEDPKTDCQCLLEEKTHWSQSCNPATEKSDLEN